ncbi:MAG: B12-binding domain-containing radical SAM protein [Candidatus Methylarchaceae archaeon HK02M1]|nr:B12-binding domain-containing radical SAM protein [Candidatus Methylarchaceae archaeon HK02M1]
MGYKVVLVADRTLMSIYRNIPLLDFLSCAPAEKIPEILFNFIAPPIISKSGVASVAPYGLRKLEAALLKGYKRSEVIVVNPDRVEDFISPQTKVIGVYTMDPLGLGPISAMFTGGKLTAYTRKYFTDLVTRIKRLKNSRGGRAKLVVGGPGSWQFQYRPEEIEKLGIDNVIVGEADRVASEILLQIEEGSAPEIMVLKQPPKVDEIPSIVNPTLHGMVEVMRGCGRNCEFCDPNLRRARYIPLSKILKEIRVNTKVGIDNVWIHSEDIFLYELEDHKNFIPNMDALLNLFQTVMSEPGVAHSNPTHGTVSAVLAEPDMMSKLSKILRASPDEPIGIQSGLETGSGRLIRRFMPSKAKPFSPEEWGDVVVEGTEVYNVNYWFPAYTLMLGLPGETDDDAWETIRLIDRLERELPRKVGERSHFTVTPISFVPVGLLKGEEFFDSTNLTEAQFCVLYKAWRHTILEIDRMPRSLLHLNPLLKLTFNLLFKFGSRALLSYIKRRSSHQGYDIERVPLLMK